MKKFYMVLAIMCFIMINVYGQDRPNAWFNRHIIVESFPFVSEGKKYTMNYTILKVDMTQIAEVYFIPDGYDKYSKDNIEPPKFHKLVYHNLGKVEDNFVGVWTYEELVIDNIPSEIKREIRLPDDIANKLVDLLSGDYKMPPNKYLKENCIKEVFDSKLLPTEIYDDYD